MQTFWSPTTILSKDDILFTFFHRAELCCWFSKKVCILLLGFLKAHKQTFWNTKQRQSINNVKKLLIFLPSPFLFKGEGSGAMPLS